LKEGVKIKRGDINMKKVFCSIGFICLAFLIGGCSKGVNIFGWTSPTGGSPQASIANGDAQFASGNYEGAMASYDAAVKADPRNSRARYGYVKAYLKSIGLDLATFLKNYSNENSAPSFVVSTVSNNIVLRGTPYLLIDDPSKPFGVDLKKFEKLVDVLIIYLDPIARGECDGYINPKSVGLNINLAFAHLLKGVFLILDNNNDGILDYNIRIESDGIANVVDLNGNLVSGGSFPGKDEALNHLSIAIDRLTTAIDNSVASDSELWKKVKDILLNVKNEINNLNK